MINVTIAVFWIKIWLFSVKNAKKKILYLPFDIKQSYVKSL